MLHKDVRGTFNKFPDFLYRLLKFTMLLLDILWDDWQIFMILGSNQ